ncbi:hypothetical protein [Humibacter sp. RRB41]|uniref:hypothetical protein n=1 Tax=Humibacter sp. RRB41 TaxID=2919946 RepID=UPI001FAB27F4|nr:hypothetical protein [Humibacter sp. RRB41]
MSAPPATVEVCLRRGIAAKKTGKNLLEAGDEWFAVCYFYAAYHTVKAAFLEDPIFDDPAALRVVNQYLIPDDRYATSHHGRVNGGGIRRMGVNDVVRILYPAVAAEYVRLHMSSVHVRYEDGLGAIAHDSVIADYDAVIGAYQRRELNHP